MNKTQEMQTFLEYFPSHFSIFEKDNDIELNSGNTVIDKETLVRNFKEPGKKKIEFLCKHIINNFRVFSGNNDYTSVNFMYETNIETIINDFKEYLKTNKKRKPKKTIENEETKKTIETKETVTEKNNVTKTNNSNELTPVAMTNPTKNINWSFEWKIMIDDKAFINGNIKSLSDLNNLMAQMKTFFTESNQNELKETTKKTCVENNIEKDIAQKIVDNNVINFEKDFSLDLTEADLNELFT